MVVSVTSAARPGGVARHAALTDAAKALEASFIAEMLKSAGLGEVRDSYSGGAGEEAFASLLADAQARSLADAGGFGLAEAVLKSLMATESGDG
jgi:flagellar protein FlgJ